METINIRYLFKLPDNQQEIIDLHLDPVTLDLKNALPEHVPSWAKLSFCQCPNCHLDIQNHPNCPIAVHLVKPLKIFQALISHNTVHVDIITPQRAISKETSAQKSLSSVMGLIMATSGCPHMEFFKPMARFHLPLASAEETVYRAASMYLLAQYFLKKEGREADFELEGLKKMYENIQTLNIAMINRLRTTCDRDVAFNSLTILNVFAQTLPFVIESSLEEMRYLFLPYLTQQRNRDEKKSPNP